MEGILILEECQKHLGADLIRQGVSPRGPAVYLYRTKL